MTVTERDRDEAHRWWDAYGDIDDLADLLARVRAEARSKTIEECVARARIESDKRIRAAKLYYDEGSKSACLSEALALRDFAAELAATGSQVPSDVLVPR